MNSPRKESTILRNKDELMSLKRAMTDIFYFVQFIYIIHPIRGKVRFDLYPFQKAVIWQFLTNQFNIVLKFRQAGITELIALYCLWLALYKENQNIVIISIKDKVAKKVLRRIKYMYKHLPSYLKVRVVNGVSHKLGTCVTPDTVIVGEKEDFELGKYIPYQVGTLNVEHLGLRVLTHKGTFERVIKTYNKGVLETWEIQDDFGNLLKCTPEHRLYTTKGWKSVRDVVKGNLDIITWDTSYFDGLESPETLKPKKEVIKETGYPGYLVSNMGNVYSSKHRNGLFKLQTRISSRGHYRVKLKSKEAGFSNGGKFFSIHRLVWETFMGEIPNGMVIDHINGNKGDNYLTNLQCISNSDNTSRAYKMVRPLVNNNHRAKTFTLKEIGNIKALIKQKPHKYGYYREIANKLGIPEKHHKRVSNMANGKVFSHIAVSKIKVLRKFENVICDMEVENAHSYITKSGFVSHNTTEMEFENGSMITSIPTTEDAGRSEAVSLLVIDEAAILRWASTIWAAAFPTLSTGGAAIVNSTPYGIGNWFHQMWVDACSSGTQFNPIRLYWDMHPERDGTWYHNMKQILGPRRTAQEIDGDFLTSGNSVFDLLDIKAIEDSLSEYLPIKLGLNGNLRIYEAPKKGVKYFLGADIASGRARDYSAFSIMKRDGEEVVCFKGKLPIEQFAKLVFDTAGDYNNALCAPEANDIGIGVIKLLQEWNYPNLYYSIQIIKEKNKKKPKKAKIPGWVTSVKNRHAMIMELESDIRNDVVVIKDPFFVQEAYTFIYNEMNKPIAMGKDKVKGDQGDELYDQVYTDDAILAKSITNFIRKGLVNSIIVAPK